MAESDSCGSEGKTGVLGRTGLKIPVLGMGTYRLDGSRPEHQAALEAAIASGSALVDTAPSYSDGAAERLIGRSLGQSKFRSRSPSPGTGIRMITKGGILSGHSLRRAVERGQAGRAYENTVKIREGLWHCLSPEFLEDEISGSLERLQQSRVEVFLLQNPEYLFMAGGNPVWFEERIRAAFLHLESEVARGRIGWYGISSNTLTGHEDDEGRVPLERLLRAARSVTPDHHFAVLEFPFNVFESDAALVPRFDGRTLMEFARDQGLGVIVNRALSAFDGRRMLRLGELPPDTRAAAAGAFVAENATQLVRRVAEAVSELHELESLIPETASHLAQSMSWGMHLEQTLEWLRDWPTWREFRETRVNPALEGMTEVHALNPDPEFQAWFRKYQRMIDGTVDLIDRRFRAEAAEFTDRLSERLDEACPALRSSSSIAAKLVRLYASVEGVDCVLVGMTKPEYVDVLSAAVNTAHARIPAAEAIRVLRSIRS